MVEAVRILIAEDHTIVRSALCAILESTPDINVVAEAADGVEAILKTRSTKPDVILMDLNMPRKTGIEAIEEIISEKPKARILVLTDCSDDNIVFEAIRAGALGYLLKNSSLENLRQAIHEVYRGESSLHPAIAHKVLRELERPSKVAPGADSLSQREIDVLVLVSRGLTNQEVAGQLHISERTVRSHVSNILGKLHLANRTQAALYALQNGLASLDEIEIATREIDM